MIPQPPQFLAICFTALMATSAFALTPAEHKTEKDRITAAYKTSHAQCKTLKGNAKDVCEAEAKGREKTGMAELDYKVKASEENRYKLAKTKADADYSVSKEKCDDLSGNGKDVCKKDAAAAHVKAVESAKVADIMNEPHKNPQARAADVSEARKDANQNIREADYKAAKERCDALAGDAKNACVNDAKRKFSQ